MRLTYVETLAALRELEVTQNLYSLDVETARVVESRVEEGDAAPLELNLLRAEVDRLRARRALVETDASLPEIGREAGYSDQSHMTRELATLLGCTPGRLRRARGGGPAA